jgi:peptidylprolyl isomerase
MAKNGDKVIIEYAGYLDDGTVFDSTAGSEPFEFTLGEGQVIAGFEKAVLGMEVGETKTVTIPTSEAYGPYREDRIVEVGRDLCPPDLDIKTGQQLQMATSDGHTVVATVIKISDTTVMLDTNSPLAGKDLTFEIRLLKIRE